MKMEERSVPDPVHPLQIEKGENTGRVLLQSSYYQLLHLFDGKLYWKTGKGIVEREAAIALVVPPGEGIRLRLAPGSSFYRILLVPWLFAEYKERHWEQGFLFFFKEKTTLFSLQDNMSQVIKYIMEVLLAENRGRKQGYLELLRLKLSELFIVLARIKTGTEPAADISYSARGIKEILQYLEAHYTEPVTLNQVALFAGYSPAYFSRYFKKVTGVCLFTYLNQIRIHKACKLLKQTDKTILEIAYLAGYNNISFFNRYFKKIMNISPLDFRKTL